MAQKTGFPVACPAAQTPLYVRRRLSDRFIGVPGTARRHRCPKALICRKFLTKAKWQCRGRTVVAGQHFAPFVYRLGRHPFTVERAVRFR